MDIKIIGAGPGGLITGLKLIKAGFKPVIIEKKPAIASTLCAEGLSAETLDRVPYGPWEEYAAHRFDYATFVFPSGQRAYAPKPCFTMDRTSWFKAMAAKISELGGTVLTGVEITPENFPKLKYDVLIDSSGPHSFIARDVVGNKMEFKPGVQYRMKLTDYQYDGMEFFLDKRYSDEYSWIFMKGDTANVGLLGSIAQLDAFIKDKGLQGEILKKEAWVIPFFGTKMQKGNVLLMGDAAGITNPLTKGGMACCVYAADILVDCVKTGRIQDYEQRLLSHPVMAPEYRTALEFFQAMPNRLLDKLGWTVANQNFARLPARTKLRLAGHSLRSWRQMRALRRAAHYANLYSW